MFYFYFTLKTLRKMLEKISILQLKRYFIIASILYALVSLPSLYYSLFYFQGTLMSTEYLGLSFDLKADNIAAYGVNALPTYSFSLFLKPSEAFFDIYFVLYALLTLLQFSFFYFGFYYLYKFAVKMKTNWRFDQKSIDIIYILLVIPAFNNGLKTINVFLLERVFRRHLDLKNFFFYTFSLAQSPERQSSLQNAIFIAIFFIFLAEIFRYAAFIQEENKHTI